MINDAFNIGAGGSDELSISIYSDAIDGMFKCESYKIKERSLIDF
jgi:hypothetical protein